MSSSKVTGRLLPGAVSGLPASSSSSYVKPLSARVALEKTEWATYHHAPYFLRDLDSQMAAHDGGLESLEVMLLGSVPRLLQVRELYAICIQMSLFVTCEKAPARTPKRMVALCCVTRSPTVNAGLVGSGTWPLAAADMETLSKSTTQSSTGAAPLRNVV